jgi:hypothetical protein
MAKEKPNFDVDETEDEKTPQAQPAQPAGLSDDDRKTACILFSAYRRHAAGAALGEVLQQLAGEYPDQAAGLNAIGHLLDMLQPAGAPTLSIKRKPNGGRMKA